MERGLQMANETMMFDEHGRRIPPPGLKAHEVSRRYYHIAQWPYASGFDLTYTCYIMAHDRAGELGVRTGLIEFANQVHALLFSIPEDMRCGPCVPFILPRAGALPIDYGAAMEKVMLPAVAEACDGAFRNYCEGKLYGRMAVAQGSRHERLLKAMAEREVVGLMFPCVTEYSVPAAIEQLASLPERFMLTGGLDMAAAFVAAPNLLLREDGYPPLLWCSGVQETPEVGFHFEAYGRDLTFNRRAHLGRMSEYWSHCLTVIA